MLVSALDEPMPGPAHQQAHSGGHTEVAQGVREDRGAAQVSRRREQDADAHDRRGDAVVQATLDIEKPPHPRRHRSIGDDLVAQVGVGRRQDGAHQECHPERDAGEQSQGKHRPQRYGQRQADGQQPQDDGRVHLQAPQPDGGSRAEEHDGQGELGEEAEHSRVGRFA